MVIVLVFSFIKRSKVHFKNLCTKFWNRCCYSNIYQTFSIQIVLQSSDRVELDFSKIALDFKSRETKKIEISSQKTYNFQILGNETLIIADCNCQVCFFGYKVMDER